MNTQLGSQCLQFLHIVLDAIPHAIFYKDVNCIYQGCNKAFADFIGHSKEEIIGHSVNDFLTESVAEWHENTDTELLRSGGRKTYQMRVLNRSGENRDMVFSKAVYHLPDGTQGGIVGVVTDITHCPAKSACYDAVWQSNQFLNSIVENIPHAVFIKRTSDLSFVLANKASEQLFGVPANELIGRNMYDVFPSQQAEIFSLHDEQVLSSMKMGDVKAIPVEVSLCETRVYHINKVPVLNAKGQAEYLLGIADDITERTLFEKKIRESEQLHQRIMKQSSDGIFAFDPSTGTIEFANEQFLQMTGYSYENILKKTIYDLSAEEVEVVSGNIDRVGRTGQVFIGVHDYRRSDGSFLSLELSLSPIEYRDRYLIIVNARDLTERMTLEQELQRDVALANRVQKRLLPEEYTSKKLIIRTIYAPHQMVSGDFFDYRWLNNGNTLFGYIADVMGHGLSTALMTTAVSVLFREASKMPGALRERLAWVNKESLHYLADHSFAAVTCFELDLEKNNITIVVCGINKFIANCFSMEGLVKLPGSLLGVHEELAFTEITLPISAGNAFYFMTDGLYDIFGRQQEINDVQNFESTFTMLKELAQKQRSSDDVAAICLKIPDAIEGVSKPHHSQGEYLKLRFQGYYGVSFTWPLIAKFLRQALSSTRASLFEIAVLEAVNNAVKYSGGIEEDATIIVKMRIIKGKRLCIRITDNGMGFNGNKHLQVLRNKQSHFEDILDQEGGRGLLFMNNASDLLLYSAKGNDVLLVKKIV